MKIVKLTTPWNHNFYAQTPGGKGIWGNYQFEIDNNCAECDVWIVWGGMRQEQQVYCPKKAIVYMTDETHSERNFNKHFLNQFEAIVACRTDLIHKRIIQTHDLGIWHFKKNYEDVISLEVPDKTRTISVVSSDLTFLDGHKKRYAFVNKLIGHFKDRIAVYGRGFNYIEDKFDGIAPYKYSIAIENSFIPNYFTEKLFECFLTYTLPIYYGCPNINDYFDDRCIVKINLDDYKESISTIEQLLEEDLYKDRIAYVSEAREKFLTFFHVFPSLVSIINTKIQVNSGRKEKITLKPELYFDNLQNTNNSFIRRFLKNIS